MSDRATEGAERASQVAPEPAAARESALPGTPGRETEVQVSEIGKPSDATPRRSAEPGTPVTPPRSEPRASRGDGASPTGTEHGATPREGAPSSEAHPEAQRATQRQTQRETQPVVVETDGGCWAHKYVGVGERVLTNPGSIYLVHRGEVRAYNESGLEPVLDDEHRPVRYLRGARFVHNDAHTLKTKSAKLTLYVLPMQLVAKVRDEQREMEKDLKAQAEALVEAEMPLADKLAREEQRRQSLAARESEKTKNEIEKMRKQLNALQAHRLRQTVTEEEQDTDEELAELDQLYEALEDVEEKFDEFKRNPSGIDPKAPREMVSTTALFVFDAVNVGQPMLTQQQKSLQARIEADGLRVIDDVARRAGAAYGFSLPDITALDMRWGAAQNARSSGSAEIAGLFYVGGDSECGVTLPDVPRCKLLEFVWFRDDPGFATITRLHTGAGGDDLEVLINGTLLLPSRTAKVPLAGLRVCVHHSWVLVVQEVDVFTRMPPLPEVDGAAELEMRRARETRFRRLDAIANAAASARNRAVAERDAFNATPAVEEFNQRLKLYYPAQASRERPHLAFGNVAVVERMPYLEHAGEQPLIDEATDSTDALVYSQLRTYEPIVVLVDKIGTQPATRGGPMVVQTVTKGLLTMEEFIRVERLLLWRKEVMPGEVEEESNLLVRLAQWAKRRTRALRDTDVDFEDDETDPLEETKEHKALVEKLRAMYFENTVVRERLKTEYGRQDVGKKKGNATHLTRLAKLAAELLQVQAEKKEMYFAKEREEKRKERQQAERNGVKFPSTL